MGPDQHYGREFVVECGLVNLQRSLRVTQGQGWNRRALSSYGKTDGTELELTDDKGKQEVKAGRVSIKSENNVVVRNATKEGDVLKLDQR